jgi:hypothetical protein
MRRLALSYSLADSLHLSLTMTRFLAIVIILVFVFTSCAHVDADANPSWWSSTTSVSVDQLRAGSAVTAFYAGNAANTINPSFVVNTTKAACSIQRYAIGQAAFLYDSNQSNMTKLTIVYDTFIGGISPLLNNQYCTSTFDVKVNLTRVTSVNNVYNNTAIIPTSAFLYALVPPPCYYMSAPNVVSCTFQLCTNNSNAMYKQQNDTVCKQFGHNVAMYDRIGLLNNYKTTRNFSYDIHSVVDTFQYEYDYSYILGVGYFVQAYNCSAGYGPYYVEPTWTVAEAREAARNPCVSNTLSPNLSPDEFRPSTGVDGSSVNATSTANSTTNISGYSSSSSTGS